jgi:phosphoribosylglycinamide formyltransferase-1
MFCSPVRRHEFGARLARHASWSMMEPAVTDESNDRLRIAVLASGAGTTLQAVIDACEARLLDASVVLVISNNSDSGALHRARAHSLPHAHLSGVTHPVPAELDGAIRAAIEAVRPDVVLLAGYMKKLGPATLRAFEGRVINTHPSLLPRHGGKGMYGSRVHAAVIAAGETESGVSVHLVDADYDTGRVLAQRRVPVEPGDDAEQLADRVQSVERPFLIEVLGQIASGEIRLSG